MRALTLYPEWAWAICRLDKRVENRGRPLPLAMVGQLVALHAGKHVGGRNGRVAKIEGHVALTCAAREAGWRTGCLQSDWPARELCPSDFKPACSSIVAFIRFGSSLPPSQGDLTGWRVPDCHGWPIVEVLRLKRPVLAPKGALGFWELPAEILQQCQEVGTVEDEQLKLFGGV